MKTKPLIVFAFILLAFAGCKKDTDNASKWVGTYTAAPGGGLGSSSDVNQVVVDESNNFTLRLFLNNYSSSSNTTVTYVTLLNVTLQNATSGTIGESDSTNGVHGLVQYSGSVSLIGGDTLRMVCTGVNGSVPAISDNFYGVKQ